MISSHGFRVTIAALQISLILANHLAREVTFVNENPSLSFEIYWMDETSSPSLLLTLQGMERAMVNTFVGHEFIVKDHREGQRGASSPGSGCRPFPSSPYRVTGTFDQQITIPHCNETSSVQPRQRAAESFRLVGTTPSSAEDNTGTLAPRATPMSSCRDRVLATMPSPTEAIAGMVDCAASSLTHALQKINDASTFEGQMRRNMAHVLEDYTCADAGLPTTEPLYETQWRGEYKVGILHDRHRSKIHVIEDFITPEECAAIETAAARNLHRASVADGKGGSTYSPNRKALQAGVRVPWETEEDPITRVSKRILDYVNGVMQLDLRPEGQEDLMAIQYTGSANETNQDSPDQYKPHCDGDCTGLPLKTGGRVATMVMYCEAPQVGGSTNFRNAGVHVAPKKGAAAFFASMGPDRIMDNGFTEHSGCPVIEGQKKIAVQWLRLGVSADNPWDSFNTLGVKPECDLDD
jgi:hypothetical protein